MSSVQLRPETKADLPFLQALYASTRADELALVPWTDAQKLAFLSMQFQAQHHHYRLHFPDASFQIIECAGEAIGRLYVHRSSSEIRIVDISLMPRYRNQGIGTALIKELLNAGTPGCPVRLCVDQFNPAVRLYERLGFRIMSDAEIYRQMEWRAEVRFEDASASAGMVPSMAT